MRVGNRVTPPGEALSKPGLLSEGPGAEVIREGGTDEAARMRIPGCLGQRPEPNPTLSATLHTRLRCAEGIFNATPALRDINPTKSAPANPWAKVPPSRAVPAAGRWGGRKCECFPNSYSLLNITVYASGTSSAKLRGARQTMRTSPVRGTAFRGGGGGG